MSLLSILELSKTVFTPILSTKKKGLQIKIILNILRRVLMVNINFYEVGDISLNLVNLN